MRFGIKIGDDIYLFNFSTGLIHGPFLAVSGADCHEPKGGRRVGSTPTVLKRPLGSVEVARVCATLPKAVRSCCVEDLSPGS